MAKIDKPSFAAIGVGQGDAFFLAKKNLAVLVDGGHSTNGFPNQFYKVTKRDSLDIIICTHNDADHALGVLGLLRSGLPCKEVWLPGSWTDRLADILVSPEAFTEELISDIKDIEFPERPPSLEQLGNEYAEAYAQQGNYAQGREPTVALSEALEKATEYHGYFGEVFLPYPHPIPPWVWPPDWYKLWPSMLIDHKRFHLFLQAISAATVIREISLAAYHMGALIKWFEFDSMSASGGIQNSLVPLNAREILQIHQRRWSAIMHLALTTANKLSLVFSSAADDEVPAVLFTADSDLQFAYSIPWANGMIITAPHHGSEYNAYAYNRFSKETGNDLHVAWVRSDGRFRTRPGNSYLNAYGSRFCTLCRGRYDAKQDVRFSPASQKWKPVFTKKCCCV